MIDETHGEEIYAREIKEYHLWRSRHHSAGWNMVGTVPAEYSNDPVTNTLKPKTGGNWVSYANKITFTDSPADGIWYYAVTSQEHSGLESDELSEVILVDVTGARIFTARIVQPQGQRRFWTVPPVAPGDFRASRGLVAGHCCLSWVEPRDSTEPARSKLPTMPATCANCCGGSGD